MALKYKSGKTEMATVLMWVLIIGVVAYAADFGGFKDTVNNVFGGDKDSGTGTNLDLSSCPTDGTTTLTINVQDALTPTATNVDSEYFIFNGNKLIKEGATGSDGSTNVDISCGKDYSIMLVNTTAGVGNGLYGKVVNYQARISDDTLNEKLIKFGGANIVGIENVDDPAGSNEASITANGVKGFVLKFNANETNRGYNKPIIICDSKISNITDITISSFSDGTPVNKVTHPSRITANTGEQLYSYEYGDILEPKDGTIAARGVLTSAAAAAPVSTEQMDCKIVDQATWQKSNYKTASSVAEGFKTSAQNDENLNDVGGYDSSTKSFLFNGTK